MCLYIFTQINIKVFSKQSALKHSLFREQITLIIPYQTVQHFFLFLREMDSDVVINVIDVRISCGAVVHTQPRTMSVLTSTTTDGAG